MSIEWWQYLVIIWAVVHTAAVVYGICLLHMEMREMKEKK